MWGDWENSDIDGNLIENEHLDLLDYLISKAKERDIYMLLTPITTYSSLFPEARADTASIQGFSKYFKKSELGTNSDAIAAQVNYIRQLLEHRNPYTGLRLKNEPTILFIEMINEPLHHPDDFEGSVAYINALVNAVKATGCKKILFHNVSQDIKIAPAIKASDVDGVSFGMYPAGLVSGRTLHANLLRAVDCYPPMLTEEIADMPRIVYEFDEADSYTPYMYPAMVRTFRSVGAQFVAMFSYDMLATAPYNLGWQTHAMNLVYYPQKALGGIIAAEIMKRIPRMNDFGPYPDNTRFGPFRIDYNKNLGEMVSDDKFMYANNTVSVPENISQLQQIIGYGSSPVVQYKGSGIYFLDKIDSLTWRMEIYPDAIVVSDPFARVSPDRLVSRLVYKEWTMSVNLPDLGTNFKVIPINDRNNHYPIVSDGTFNIRPGVYLLTANKHIELSGLPDKIGNVYMTEFIVPPPIKRSPDVMISSQTEYVSSEPIIIKADIISDKTIHETNLYLNNTKFRGLFFKIPMKYESGYAYTAIIPKMFARTGLYEYCIAVNENNEITTFPSKVNTSPDQWDFHEDDLWQFRIVNEKTPLRLLIPEEDISNLAFTRIGDDIRYGIYDVVFSESTGEAAYRIYYPESYDANIGDYTMSLIVKVRIETRGKTILTAKNIRLTAKAEHNGQKIYVTLMEADGTSWFRKVILTNGWNEYSIPLNELTVGKGVKLPLGFPERWNYWVEPAKDRGGPKDYLHIDEIERLQVSIRSSVKKDIESDTWIELGAVYLLFE